MTSVVMRNLQKSFGATKVIKGVSVNISDGEFVVLVGPSGCGKSTLLRMLAGLESITAGEIFIGDRRVNDVAPKARDIAMVFQNYALYPHMTAAENMSFALRLKGAPKAMIEEKVARAASILGIGDLLARVPAKLSGGQRQRVAMGRAMVRDPKVFLFDEPLSNLDAKLRVQMRAEIKSLHQRLGATIIYVTHDQIEAMTMADKIVVLRDGLVEQIGAPLDLYDRPANAFVASFIGSPSMNMLRGAITHEDGAVFFEADGALRIRLPASKAVVDAGPVILGIRPEHVTIEPDGFSAEIVVVEPTGSETHVMARAGAHSFVGVFRERILQRPGETLRLAASPAQIHLFDAQSGARLAV